MGGSRAGFLQWVHEAKFTLVMRSRIEAVCEKRCSVKGGDVVTFPRNVARPLALMRQLVLATQVPTEILIRVMDKARRVTASLSLENKYDHTVFLEFNHDIQVLNK